LIRIISVIAVSELIMKIVAQSVEMKIGQDDKESRDGISD
jgi:hypothetical protein